MQIHLTAVLKCYGFARSTISFGTSLSISHLKTGSNYVPNGLSARRIIWEIEYTVQATLWPTIRCLFSVNWWGICEHVSLLILGNKIHCCGWTTLKLLCSNAACPDTQESNRISLHHSYCAALSKYPHCRIKDTQTYGQKKITLYTLYIALNLEKNSTWKNTIHP